MQRTGTVAGLILLLAALAAAADISGKWRGQFTAPDGNHDLTFDFKVKGSTLTGTVTDVAGGQPAEIQEGKVDGDKVGFFMLYDYNGQPLKVIYTGQLSGAGEMQMTVGLDDGTWGAEFVAKRPAS
jgi:opacity protein-like surface antigen